MWSLKHESVSLTDCILTTIVRRTNQCTILIFQPNLSRKSDARFTEKTETKDFIGLRRFPAAFRSYKQNLEELWSTERKGTEKCSLVMNQRRFQFLI